MWKQRKAKDYFSTENIKDQTREVISKETIKELLERLAFAEGWLLKDLLGENYVIRAAAVNVKVLAKKDQSSDNYFGDLYVVQNIKNQVVSFKLYCPKLNRFIWSVDALPNLDGYLDLKCNTQILHLGNSIYTFKFPNKKERYLFRDTLIKFIYFEKTKR